MVGSISLTSEVSLLLLVPASNHQFQIKCAKNSLRYRLACLYPALSFAGASLSQPCSVSTSTGWPEAVAHPRLPQNVACGFAALRSSEIGLQYGDSLQLPLGEIQLWP